MLLITNAGLSLEQRNMINLKRSGMQSFDVVADMLRLLDKPEAYLNAAGPPPKKILFTDHDGGPALQQTPPDAAAQCAAST